MQLSVIILNYNVRYFLEQCVLSVQKALEHIEGEIIVVDNASTDESCEMMKQKFPEIKLIRNSENVGFPKGNNIGVAHASGEYICILNPDTVVAEDTFEKLFNFCHSELVSESNTGIIGCKLIDGTGQFLPECKRGVPTPWVAFTKIFGLYKLFPRLKWFNQYYAQHIAENENGEVAILVGAFMFMKRDLYLQVGGFDENCFMYSDDIDLSYMVQQLGKKNYYFAETTVIHYKGESTVRDATYRKRFQEAMQFFYGKHFKKSVLFDYIMRFGSFVFSFFKKSQQQNRVVLVDEFVVFTKNSDLKFEALEEKKCTYLSDFNLFDSDSKKNREVIFDTSTFSFKEITSFMQSKANQKCTFKNYLANSNYGIGSNHANDRGEVKILK
ncbi:Glycosyl transferase, group 2 family protein [Flavobacterium indicum GPTSA100-9 = DSM 17447]|uniref:Glycosyl transferase, group 2 family protein n=1 Tax=Flavobacterium indicum (strain DSM 17447 / CIP 109464 / GPTSA100-9) TaxID=1094466 RepID=H8XVK2_FLAIG|nr:glycosyltransferase family 2 protein [Flavobacterium indicum]CCG53966.1 Glycosyl transferase, group 2 family protein [Flavobacterium indicum GPTSA100-9 = DSM 17447]